MATTKYYDGVREAQRTQGPIAHMPPFDMERMRAKGWRAKLTSRLLENPRWVLGFLRRFHPVLKIGDFVLVTRSEDVREILERQDVFQTPYGLEMAEIAGGTNFILGMQDGPEYRRMKSTVLSAFPADEVEGVVRPMAARHASAIMQRAAPRFDAVAALLRVVPVRICRDYFGILIDDEEAFSDWANALSGLFFADPGADPVTRELAVVAADRVRRSIDRSVMAVREGTVPNTTPLGRLVKMLDAEEPQISLGEVHAIMLGMIAGFTPTNLLASGNCLDVVLSKPEARRAVEEAIAAGDDARLERAILEAMRFKPIWVGPFRYTARDAVLAKGTRRERKIKAGTTVMPATLSAMFDPAVVREPERFDTDRPARDYMVFGHGIHQCIGAAIARIQIAECFRALFSKPGLKRGGGKDGRLKRLGAYPESLTVCFDPAPLSRTVQHAMVTAVFPCDRDAPLDALRERVDRLGNPAGEAMTRALDASGVIHFASIAVIDGRSERESNSAGHLVVELSGDGTKDQVVDAFVQGAEPILRELFAMASGTSGHKPAGTLIRDNALDISPTFGSNAGLVFSGTPGHSVRRIRAEAELEKTAREEIAAAPDGAEAGRILDSVRQKLANDGRFDWAFEPAETLLEKPAGSLASAVKRTLRAPKVLVAVTVTLLICLAITYSLVFGYAPGFFRNLLIVGTSIVLTLIGVIMLLAFIAGLLILYLRRLEKRDVPSDRNADLSALEEISKRENHLAQNHLTAVSTLKGGWLRRLALRLSFYLISIMARQVFRPGYLSDINTIHFARWVLLPATKQLVFFSNYGGSWESYLEDFITKARAGLTGVWSNTEGFPRTRMLFFDGASDGDRFKRWARAQQVPTLFWYAAYPGLTTARIRINSLIRSGIAKAETESEARDWLRLFGSQPRPRDTLEIEEIQSIFFGPLGPLAKAELLAFHIPADLPRPARREWLAFLLERTSFGNQLPPERAMITLFGPDGLRRLGLGERSGDDRLDGFPAAFRQGMATEARSRVLDDIGKSAPERWAWGSQEKPVDVAVICYARMYETLDKDIQSLMHATDKAGVKPVAQLPLEIKREGGHAVEQFGFADGISQPIVRGTPRAKESASPMHLIAPGEFLLGYPDENALYPPSPTIVETEDRLGILPVVETGEETPLFGKKATLRDFGRNGSFMVIRQLEQHVSAFNTYCRHAAEAVRTETGNARLDSKWIAAKMIGRWQDGTSLVRNPNGRNDREPDNDFAFALEDSQGLHCPLGSHVRRSNPRDSLGDDPQTQLRINNRHRILRCGRTYKSDQETGLLFMCLNADIERQYEFMQQSWISASFFQGLTDEKDPAIGANEGKGSFSIPIGEGRLMLRDLPSFVTTRGGGYFFMPSRSSLRYLLSRL
ncbi:cytochrome P450 [Nitratireductor kimnyeongensis]|uniref:Cytochrome P450 n=1 Tax=Nitratireductor kimnyeongensis TaxID=430679 RepID=A0ABW0TEY2_9HYPH|nr:cytochrome P450 [Nitratireductor kimnyeongensis]QZZ37218.1 cytochrome P450 [Nitratireductor kimnyeongensis]